MWIRIRIHSPGYSSSKVFSLFLLQFLLGGTGAVSFLFFLFLISWPMEGTMLFPAADIYLYIYRVRVLNEMILGIVVHYNQRLIYHCCSPPAFIIVVKCDHRAYFLIITLFNLHFYEAYTVLYIQFIHCLQQCCGPGRIRTFFAESVSDPHE